MYNQEDELIEVIKAVKKQRMLAEEGRIDHNKARAIASLARIEVTAQNSITGIKRENRLAGDQKI